MKVLGVHIGHDSSAALIIDGQIVADVAEERFTRIKHYARIPFKSIEYCLKAGNISIEEVDVIAVPTKYPLVDLNILFNLNDYRREKRTWKGQAFEMINLLKGGDNRKLPIYIKNFPNIRNWI